MQQTCNICKYQLNSPIFDQLGEATEGAFDFVHQNLKSNQPTRKYYPGAKKFGYLFISVNQQGGKSYKPLELKNSANGAGIQTRPDNIEEQNYTPADMTTLQKSYFILDKNRLIQFYSATDIRERAVLELNNCRLKPNHFKDKYDSRMHGFMLMAKGTMVELYTARQPEQQEWIEAMKPYVVLVDLKHEFTIGKLIGKGQSAQLHVGQSKTKQNEQLAVKTINKSFIQEKDENMLPQQSLLDEIRILRMVNHPNVIKLYEVYETRKYIHLILSHLQGGDLFKRIRTKSLYKELDAIPIMRDFLSGLDHLHSQLIMHRDLKPENLIFAKQDDNSVLQIADFGLTLQMQGKDQLFHDQCGSPGYVAPEVLRQEGYNHQCDIFSAGVILYAILTGKSPFEGTDVNTILMNNMECKLKISQKHWKIISAEAKDLVMQMLQEDKNLRITAKEALKHPWFNSNASEFDQAQQNIHQIQRIRNQPEFDKKRSNLLQQQQVLRSQTPLMAGIYRDNAPPATPWLKSDAVKGHQTPVMKQMNVIRQNPKSEQGEGFSTHKVDRIHVQQEQDSSNRAEQLVESIQEESKTKQEVRIKVKSESRKSNNSEVRPKQSKEGLQSLGAILQDQLDISEIPEAESSQESSMNKQKTFSRFKSESEYVFFSCHF